MVAQVNEQIQQQMYQQARKTLEEAIQNNQRYHCADEGALAHAKVGLPAISASLPRLASRQHRVATP